MNILKKITTPFFAILLVSMVFVSCQKESNELTDQDIRTTIEAQVEVLKAEQLNSINNPDTPLYRAPTTGNSTCYGASITVDADCDYVYELGWNEETYSWNACWTKVIEMGITATQNQWCWYYPDVNCQAYTCNGPGPGEPGGGTSDPGDPCPDGC